MILLVAFQKATSRIIHLWYPTARRQRHLIPITGKERRQNGQDMNKIQLTDCILIFPLIQPRMKVVTPKNTIECSNFATSWKLHSGA